MSADRTADQTAPASLYAPTQRAAARQLAWLLITIAAALALVAAVWAARTWPGTPWAALAATPAITLITLVLYRALFGKD